jgi:hypothetical protein
MYMSMARVKGGEIGQVVRECREHYRRRFGVEADTVLVSTRAEGAPEEVEGLRVARMRWILPGSVAVARLGGEEEDG